MALKPFYNKKGHLGMTRQQVKAALQAAQPETFTAHITRPGDDFVIDVSPNELTAAVKAGKKIALDLLGLYTVNPIIAHVVSLDTYSIQDIPFFNPDLFPSGMTLFSFVFVTSQLDNPFTVVTNFVPFYS